MNALNVLCAQLTRDLFAIAKFLLNPDLKHFSTEGPISISNHSVTFTAPAIRLSRANIRRVFKFVYLLIYYP